MNRYVIGSAATGEILRSVSCGSEYLESQAQDGEVLDLHDDATWETHFFQDGALVAYSDAQRQAKASPPSPAARWSNTTMSFADATPVAELKAEASVAIDNAAGAARARYITEVPGQQAVYLRKAEQSRAFRDSGYAGAPPPYVAAEAAAMGMTPQAAADRILAIADAWDDQLSPAIEGLRIWGKNAVELAADAAAVATARASAITGLATI